MATSKFIKYFETNSGLPLEGALIYLVEQGKAFNTNMPVAAHTTRKGYYTREAVKDGEYDLWINFGTGAQLYESHIWHGENKQSKISVGFDDSGIQGGNGIMDSTLIEWTRAECFSGIISKTSNSPVNIKWPDGSLGTFTATTLSIYGIDAFIITHALSGKTITQPQITRDVNGYPSIIPEMLIS